MPNPSIEELLNPEKFELIAQLNHSQIKEFVINQLMQNGKIIKFYMIYQILMIMTGMFFFTRSVVLAFQSSAHSIVLFAGCIDFLFFGFE
jgi:hypothetical protein